MYTENFMTCAEPQTCEVCGRETMDSGPCTMCQVWVQNYSDALMLRSFSS